MTAVAQGPSGPTTKSVFRRPTNPQGIWDWLTTIDHKKIGVMYFVTALFFFLVAGAEALLIRAQLAQPNGEILSGDVYNQIYTMHGLTMVFWAAMPMIAAFFNYLLPLMIGARDVAYPRLNAFSYWVFLVSGIFVYSSVLTGGMPDGGWFNYASLSIVGPDPSGTTQAIGPVPAALEHAQRMLFYSVGIQIAGIASLASSVNFIVTIFNMRPPGMTLMRLPVFVWMSLIVSFLMLFAMPVIGVACWQLMFDVRFSANFFRPSAGGDPVMWQHLFWIFGHPEVYILILPSFGIVSEVLPVFSRKPIFGYTALVFSGIAIGFLGWGVWAHHMFASGLGPVANTAFSLTTMLIGIPTGVKIFNWIGTMWGGRLRFTTPMLFAIGLVSMFTIGGLSGVTHAVAPHNYQQTDSYYVVAHFHYVLFGGAIFGLMAGVYYWFPKVTGRMLSERLGKVHFWGYLIGFNLTFAPMHILGLNGMPRRIDTYPEGFGWEFWNLVVSGASLIIAAATLVFAWNLFRSARKGDKAGNDPWDARTVEWLTTSPPPPHNFDEIPEISARDELWHRKYAIQGEEPVPVPSGGAGDDDSGLIGHEADNPGPTRGEDVSGLVTTGEETPHDIHMPSPSYYPLISALGMPIMGWALMFDSWQMISMLALGGVITFGALFGWVLEPGTAPEDEH